jgi:predicted amidophosphoribosyltransferase
VAKVSGAANLHFSKEKELFMCFRPGGVVKPQECPKCGKKLAMIGGIKQKICPFCKTPLTEEKKPEEEKKPAEEKKPEE